MLNRYIERLMLTDDILLELCDEMDEAVEISEIHDIVLPEEAYDTKVLYYYDS